jgi:lysophospholipase L1-like esterase
MPRVAPLVAAVASLLLSVTWAAADRGPATGPVNPADYKAKVRVACVGDSITFGSGVKEREVNNYPAQLGRMLGDEWEVRNFGVSGATMLKKGDKPYDKQKAYTDALAWKPDVVVIKLGTNDSKPQNWKHKQDFAADARAMALAFREVNPAARVFLCLPVPAYPGDFGIRDEVIKGEQLPVLREVAKETNATLVDLYAALSDKKELFPDKVHPNAEGATVIAKTVYKALTGKDAPAAKEGKQAVE